ncbi:MAG: prolipoprotein diacylglyceryl transferase [Chloroflexi bacterium]|nr:prolipoprotein diacylglyceryl transferase [Chloroflexota bacterium]
MNGITINIDPVLVQVGGLALRWYSLSFAVGIAVAILLVTREAQRRGLATARVQSIALWAVVGGLLGARLFHVVDRLDYYLARPYEILMVYHGGLAIWGGLIVGGVAAFLAARKEGIAPLALADAATLGMIAGQMIGRIGCVINGDAYGGPTGLPWGLVYTHPGAMVPEALKGVPTHPYPVYELLWDAALLGLLLLLRRRSLPTGALFATYVAGYSLGRFLLTFVRQEAIVFWGLQQAQVIALAAFVLAIAGIVALTRPNRLKGTQRRSSMAARKR